MPRARRVAFIGDSITEGFGITGQPWPQIVLARRQGDNVAGKNLANSGEKVAQFVSRYDDEVRNRGYTTVVFGPVTNDFPDGTTGAAIYASLIASAQDAEAEGCDVVLCTTLPRGNGPSYSAAMQTEIDALNTAIRAAPGTDLSASALVVDFNVAMGEPGTPVDLAAALDSGDGLHPNQAGHTEMADTFDAIVTLW